MSAPAAQMPDTEVQESAPIRKDQYDIEADAGQEHALLANSDSEAIAGISHPALWSRWRTFSDQNAGLLLLIKAQIFYASMAAAVSFLSQLPEASVPTSELIAVRMSITFCCCHVWLRWTGDPHPLLGPPGVRLLMVARGVVGFFSLAGLYYSLRYLPLSDAVVIGFLSPSITGVMAALLLKESYRPFEALAGVVSLLGVMLIAKPAALFGEDAGGEPLLVDGREVTPQQRLIAVIVALVGCLGSAGVTVLLRLIGSRASPTHSITYFAALSTVLGCLGPIVFPRDQAWVLPGNSLFTVVLVGIGAFGFMAQVLVAKGLSLERAGRGSLAAFLQMPFAMALERVLFGRTMDVLSFLGASLIVASALAVLFGKSADKSKDVAVAGKAVSGGGGRAGPSSPAIVLSKLVPAGTSR